MPWTNIIIVICLETFLIPVSEIGVPLVDSFLERYDYHKQYYQNQMPSSEVKFLDFLYEVKKNKNKADYDEYKGFRTRIFLHISEKKTARAWTKENPNSTA